MYKIRRYGLWVVLLMLLASCEKTIDVKLPPYSSKLTINSATRIGEAINSKVGVTQSADHKSQDPGTLTVKLYVDSVLSGELNYDPTEDLYKSHVVAEAGKLYTVKVSSSEAGFGTASASSIAPSVVTIASVVHKTNVRLDADGNYQDEIDLSFDDPPAAGDYYIIRLHTSRDSGWASQGTYSFCVNSDDASIETSTSDFVSATTCLASDDIFMRDPTFNGTHKTVRLFAGSNDIQPVMTSTDTSFSYIELQHITAAGYKYAQTSRVAKDTNGDPFSEPVNVYTNVTNGYGIVTILSSDIKKIE